MAEKLRWTKMTFRFIGTAANPRLEIKSDLFETVEAVGRDTEKGPVWCFDLTHKETGQVRHTHMHWTRGADIIEKMLTDVAGKFIYDIERQQRRAR